MFYFSILFYKYFIHLNVHFVLRNIKNKIVK